MEQYTKLAFIGSGTYGDVYKAKEKSTRRIFAVKDIINSEGEKFLSSSAIREVGVLKQLNILNHENIIKLHNVFLHKSKLSLIFEYLPWDLKKFIDHVNKKKKINSVAGLSEELSMSLIYQLLTGLDVCHGNYIIHRDLKPSNLLLRSDGLLKITDFGLARFNAIPSRTSCHEVVTLWYRSPEILLGVKHYEYKVDIWSVGCIIAEMFTGRVLFPGDSEIDQLFQIFRKKGTPTESNWAGLESLPDYQRSFPKFQGTELLTLPFEDESAFDLIRCCLHYDPQNRQSTDKLLQQFFPNGADRVSLDYE